MNIKQHCCECCLAYKSSLVFKKKKVTAYLPYILTGVCVAMHIWMGGLVLIMSDVIYHIYLLYCCFLNNFKKKNVIWQVSTLILMMSFKIIFNKVSHEGMVAGHFEMDRHKIKFSISRIVTVFNKRVFVLHNFMSLVIHLLTSLISNFTVCTRI